MPTLDQSLHTAGFVIPCDPIQHLIADLLPGLLEQALQHVVPVPGGVLLQELSEWVEVFEDAVERYNLIDQCPVAAHVRDVHRGGELFMCSGRGWALSLVSLIPAQSTVSSPK